MCHHVHYHTQAYPYDIAQRIAKEHNRRANLQIPYPHSQPIKVQVPLPALLQLLLPNLPAGPYL